MARYGIPYMGSKSAIADELIANLPSGNRFVDLFGGGFAISECALKSRKWKSILYNDINPLLIPLIRDAINGKYNYKNFIPDFINRAEFEEKKRIDGYVKWIWSFGNDGWSYMYGREKEVLMQRGHEWVFHDVPIEGFDLDNAEKDIVTRRQYIQRYIPLRHLTRIERLAHLETLRTYMSQIKMTSMDYRDYKYQDGDVVYCDIPYQNVSSDKRESKQYNTRFNHGEFYAWAVDQKFPVYFSSYKLGTTVWEREKRIFKGGDNQLIRSEALYCVDNNPQHKNIYQGMLFERKI